MISFRGFHGDNDSRVSSISSPIFLSVFFSSLPFPGFQAAAMVSVFSWIYMVVHITEKLTDQFYHPLATILICTQNPSSDSFVFSPSINLKKKKSLNSTRKLKKREEKRDRKGEKEKQNQRNKKGILSDPELFFSRLELHCLLSLQLTIVGSNTSVEAPMRYLCVRFWHVLHSMHLTCL